MYFNIGFNFSTEYFRKKFQLKSFDFFCYEKRVLKNKLIETQLTFWPTLLTEASITYRGRTDHAGISMDIAILGLNFIVSFTDRRHWDDDKDTWEVYPDETN